MEITEMKIREMIIERYGSLKNSVKQYKCPGLRSTVF